MQHLSGNADNLIKSDVSTVLNVFLLLSVSWWFLDGFDDQSRSRRYHLSLGLSVLNGQFHCNPQSLPITSCLGDVITSVFWRQTQGADLGGQGRCPTDFPTSAPQVHDFDLVGVELRRHGGGGWCQMNPDLGGLKKVAPWPPLSRKPKSNRNLIIPLFACLDIPRDSDSTVFREDCYQYFSKVSQMIQGCCQNQESLVFIKHSGLADPTLGQVQARSSQLRTELPGLNIPRAAPIGDRPCGDRPPMWRQALLDMLRTRQA